MSKYDETIERAFSIVEGEYVTDWLGDVECEIVRCRDCTSFMVDGNQVAKCTTPCGDSLHGTASCDPDGFCAWGTRRDE